MKRRTGPRTEVLEPRLVLSSPRLQPVLAPGGFETAGGQAPEIGAVADGMPEADPASTAGLRGEGRSPAAVAGSAGISGGAGRDRVLPEAGRTAVGGGVSDGSVSGNGVSDSGASDRGVSGGDPSARSGSGDDPVVFRDESDESIVRDSGASRDSGTVSSSTVSVITADTGTVAVSDAGTARVSTAGSGTTINRDTTATGSDTATGSVGTVDRVRTTGSETAGSETADSGTTGSETVDSGGAADRDTADAGGTAGSGTAGDFGTGTVTADDATTVGDAGTAVRTVSPVDRTGVTVAGEPTPVDVVVRSDAVRIVDVEAEEPVETDARIIRETDIPVRQVEGDLRTVETDEADAGAGDRTRSERVEREVTEERVDESEDESGTQVDAAEVRARREEPGAPEEDASGVAGRRKSAERREEFQAAQDAMVAGMAGDGGRHPDAARPAHASVPDGMSWLDGLAEAIGDWMTPAGGMLASGEMSGSSASLLAAGGVIPVLMLARKSGDETQRGDSGATSELAGVLDRKWWKERRRLRSVSKSRRGTQRRSRSDSRPVVEPESRDSLATPDISEAFAMSVMKPFDGDVFAMAPLAADGDDAGTGDPPSSDLLESAGMGAGATAAAATAAGVARHRLRQRRSVPPRPDISYSGTTRADPS